MRKVVMDPVLLIMFKVVWQKYQINALSSLIILLVELIK